MARKLRLEYAGACYHVINRGNYRRNLFAGKGAAESFESCLGEAAGRFSWRLHAYVVMRNHFHLAVELTEPNLSEGMRWLQATWAARFNRLRGETGRPFQGRYKALHVEPGPTLAQVCHYIHLNPVRAKIVPVERLLEYRWSSLPRFSGRSRPRWLEPRTVLGESGGLADTPVGWRNYLRYLGVAAEEEASLRQEKFGRLSRGWALGTEAFRKDLHQSLSDQAADSDRFALLGADGAACRQVREELWETKLQVAAKALGMRLDGLPAKRSDPGKVALAAALKLTTSVSNGWLARRLGMGEPASVSQYVRRFRLRNDDSQRDFQRALSRVKP